MAEDVFGIVGSVLAGAYKVEAVVAEGGFGVVYRAYHSGFRAPVALKCLKMPQHIGQKHQAEFLEQFRAEAELLFRLSASIPTVVRPLHVDAVTTASGTFVPYIALEWLEGETLDGIVEKRTRAGERPFGLRKLVRLLTPVARALERAHNFSGPDGPISIVHRDLKPENIFVAKVAGEETVKILDFGIGKAKSVASQVAGRASQTQAGFSSFTPAYGAPEQWMPKRFGQTGPWTDVWGLALTMVEVMAARPIIDGDQASMMGTTLDAQRRPTPRTEGIEVSDAVETVFRRALALDPRERQADAGVFWNELLAALGVSHGERVSSVPPRDPRSEGGAVPREEQFSSRAPARGAAPPASHREAETVARAELEAPAVQGPAAQAPTVPPSIPDLTLEASPARQVSSRMTPSRRSSASGRPLTSPTNKHDVEFDEAADGAGHISLDLPEDEQRPTARTSVLPSRRISSSNNPAVVSATEGAAAVSLLADAPGRTSFAPSSSPQASVQPPMSGSRPRIAAAHSAPTPHDEASVVRRLAPGIALLVVSILLPIIDQIYASAYGEVLTIGPVRMAWLAGAFMLAGIAVVIYKLLPRA
jgi:serine/threonine-protein kinase